VETGLKPNLAGGVPERVWLIASHIPPLEDMRKFAAKLLGPEWQETACYQGEGAVLFCFRGSGTSGTASRRGLSPGLSGSAAAALPGERACR
jgi:hypothetical protein